MQTSTGIPCWKRTLDLTCVLVSAPMWLPLMVLLTLWIMLASRGPVFFVQERVGFRGNTFKILKFRSMKMGAATAVHEQYFKELVRSDRPMVKLDTLGDHRLIPLGWLIRASGLDELPQIINVLRGEMSLVGPRPCTLAELANYEPWQHQRFDAPPGLTGYWQVNGKNRTTFHEMMCLDIAYTRRMSLGLDLLIMFRTPAAIFTQVFRPKAPPPGQRPTYTNRRPASPVSTDSHAGSRFSIHE